MAQLPDKLHEVLRTEELHPAGPRWTVATKTALFALPLTPADLGQLALVLADGRSWWVCTLDPSEGGAWHRIDAPEGVADMPLRVVEFTQPVASSEWDVVHGMDGYPPVVVMNDDGVAVSARVHYVDRTRIVVTFASPCTGRLSIGW